MKKYILAVMSCLLAAGVLTACGSEPALADLEPAVPSASVQTAQTAAEAGITYTVEKDVEEDSASADDGTLLATCRYEIPILHAIREDGTEILTAETAAEKQALAVTDVFAGEFTHWTDGSDFQETAQWAGDDYDLSRTGDGFPWTEGCAYAAELTTSVWQTDHLVSIRAQYYTYTGGAHPNTVSMAWNFDVDAGAFIDPTVLANDEMEFRSAVTQEIIRQAELPLEDGTVPAAGYWENYQDIAAEWTNYAVSFGDDGMTVEFSPYELACYAAGEQSFTMDCAFLREYLSGYGYSLLGMSMAQETEAD